MNDGIARDIEESSKDIQRLLLKKEIKEGIKQDFDFERKLLEIQRSQERFTAFARWVKEIALLILVAFVVQSLLAGANFSDTVVLVSIGASFVTYAGAVLLMYIK